jgi:hypothetical protein
MNKKYVVELTKDERKRLRKLISAGTAPARMLNRARILLLKADVGEHAKGEMLIDKEIAKMLETSTAIVQRVRERFCTHRVLMQRWSARCQIGYTSASLMDEPKLT